MTVQFKKAVKFDAKGRVALIGPAGSGKSYTMLVLARLLAGPNGKIAAVDTEHGSLSKYADLFDFDVLELDTFSPKTFEDALNAAEHGGYAVFCCDSLSHFWTGKDGALEFVDEQAKAKKDSFAGWKSFRPHERAMVDRMIASPCHIITTMRTKTDYQEVEINGKKKRVKVGLAPVQRDGMEYEFDLVGYMDDENVLAIDKTRCPAYSQRAITRPDAKAWQPFADWLKGAELPAAAPAAPAPQQPQRAAEPAPAANGHANGKAAHQWRWDEDNQDRLHCHVLDVSERKKKDGKGRFQAIRINGQIADAGGKDVIFNFHESLFDAVRLTADEDVTLLLSVNGGYCNVEDVEKIGDQAFKGGKPFAEGQNCPEVTDQDIPF